MILPGDRIIEVDLAKGLGMSRVPIREALRTLESQGVVTSTPYKGIRLMEVTHERLQHITDVRAGLETLAARRAIESGRNDAAGVAVLMEARRELELMSQRADVFAFAQADAAFHRQLIGLGGNPVLAMLWESLARQMTIIVGLSTYGRPMDEIVIEHDVLIDAFASGDQDRMARELSEHIVARAHTLDFDAIISERRARQK